MLCPSAFFSQGQYHIKPHQRFLTPVLLSSASEQASGPSHSVLSLLLWSNEDTLKAQLMTKEGSHVSVCKYVHAYEPSVLLHVHIYAMNYTHVLTQCRHACWALPG